MSELDLIKKLEKLSNEKPKREWVDFTRESILASAPQEERSFWQSLRLTEFAPVMICVFSALLVGGIISVPDQVEKELMTASIENNATASVFSANNEEKGEQAVSPASTMNVEDINEASLAVLLEEEGSEEVFKELENRVERIKNEVKACKKLEEQGLLEEGTSTKTTCDEFEEQLNYLSQYLDEGNN